MEVIFEVMHQNCSGRGESRWGDYSKKDRYFLGKHSAVSLSSYSNCKICFGLAIVVIKPIDKILTLNSLSTSAVC